MSEVTPETKDRMVLRMRALGYEILTDKDKEQLLMMIQSAPMMKALGILMIGAEQGFKAQIGPLNLLDNEQLNVAIKLQGASIAASTFVDGLIELSSPDEEEIES